MATKNLTDVRLELLKAKPSVLPSLRMSTCPPLAVDRLIGLVSVSGNLVKTMEKRNRFPPRMPKRELGGNLKRIGEIIENMADPDVFVWLERGDDPSEQELYRAATIVADRLCGAVANPIIRNAQEKRQLTAIGEWLTALGYRHLPSGKGTNYDDLQPGTYSFRLNVPVEQKGTAKTINIPVDVVVMPNAAKAEATKMNQLRRIHGDNVRYILFLCGYFDSGYLGYEAAEGIDWVWEHQTILECALAEYLKNANA